MFRTILFFGMLVFYSIYGFGLWFVVWIVHFFNQEKADYMIFHSIQHAARFGLFIAGMKVKYAERKIFRLRVPHLSS